MSILCLCAGVRKAALLFGVFGRSAIAAFVASGSTVLQAAISTDADWARLHPEELKASIPVVLSGNPFLGARIGGASRPGVARLKKEQLKRLRRYLDANIRGVVMVGGRPLLLLGGRICQLGQELNLPKDVGPEVQGLTIRIKALEPGRVILLLGDGAEDRDESCEEWVYVMSDFMSTR